MVYQDRCTMFLNPIRASTGMHDYPTSLFLCKAGKSNNMDNILLREGIGCSCMHGEQSVCLKYVPLGTQVLHALEPHDLNLRVTSWPAFTYSYTPYVIVHAWCN